MGEYNMGKLVSLVKLSRGKNNNIKKSKKRRHCLHMMLAKLKFDALTTENAYETQVS